MENLLIAIEQLSSWLWGWPLLTLISLIAACLTLALKGVVLIRLPFAILLLWRCRTSQGDSDISGIQAFLLALTTSIGSGSVAGVATAIALGGPGALFWMWVFALLGITLKYCEAVLSVHYRETNEQGQFLGGPMLYIKKGLPSSLSWVGYFYAVLAVLVALSVGNQIQTSLIANRLEVELNSPIWLTGCVLAILAGSILLGGIRRLGRFVTGFMPLVLLGFIITALAVLIHKSHLLGDAFSLVFRSAFDTTPAIGGFAGASVMTAMQSGVFRSFFSTEAGMGHTAIAHACTQVKHPTQQGLLASFTTVIDTFLISTLTGLVIITTDAWLIGDSGTPLAQLALASIWPTVGNNLISFWIVIFAFTTLLGWGFYGEKCTEFLFGVKSAAIFRWVWIFAIPLGVLVDLEFIWVSSNLLMACMIIPNLMALLCLSPVVIQLTKEYFSQSGAPKAEPEQYESEA